MPLLGPPGQRGPRQLLRPPPIPLPRAAPAHISRDGPPRTRKKSPPPSLQLSAAVEVGPSCQPSSLLLLRLSPTGGQRPRRASPRSCPRTRRPAAPALLLVVPLPGPSVDPLPSVLGDVAASRSPLFSAARRPAAPHAISFLTTRLDRDRRGSKALKPNPSHARSHGLTIVPP